MPGCDQEPSQLPRLVLVRPRRKRPRPDQGHVTAHHIPELRQFVQAGATQQVADRRDARVVARLEERARHLIDLGQLREATVRTLVHGAELQDVEAIEMPTRAPLPVDDLPGGAELDHRGNQEAHRRQEAGALAAPRRHRSPASKGEARWRETRSRRPIRLRRCSRHRVPPLGAGAHAIGAERWKGAAPLARGP